MNDNTFMPAAVERGRTINPVALAEEARFALSTTTNPAEIMQIEAKLDAVERLMRETGLYPLAEIRLVNEERMRARWCLGAALESVVKDKPGPKPQGVTSAGLMQFLKQLELDHQTALEARRIAALPDKIFQEAIEKWRARRSLALFRPSSNFPPVLDSGKAPGDASAHRRGSNGGQDRGTGEVRSVRADLCRSPLDLRDVFGLGDKAAG